MHCLDHFQQQFGLDIVVHTGQCGIGQAMQSTSLHTVQDTGKLVLVPICTSPCPAKHTQVVCYQVL